MSDSLASYTYDPLMDHTYVLDGCEGNESPQSTSIDSSPLNNSSYTLSASHTTRSSSQPSSTHPTIPWRPPRLPERGMMTTRPKRRRTEDGSLGMPPRLPSPPVSHLLYSSPTSNLKTSARLKKKTAKQGEKDTPHAIKTVATVKRPILQEPKKERSTSADDPTQGFVIERILKKKKVSGRKPKYLVKWLGYSDMTWEPRSNLGSDCPAFERFREEEMLKAKSPKVHKVKTEPASDESNSMELGSLFGGSQDEMIAQEVAALDAQRSVPLSLMCLEELDVSALEMMDSKAEPVIQVKVIKVKKPKLSNPTQLKPMKGRDLTMTVRPIRTGHKAHKLPATALPTSDVTTKSSNLSSKPQKAKVKAVASLQLKAPLSPEIPPVISRPRRQSLWSASLRPAPRPRPFTADISKKPSSALDLDEPPHGRRDISATVSTSVPLSSLLRSQMTSLTSVGVQTERCENVRGTIPIAETGCSGLHSGAMVVCITGFRPRELAITCLEDISFLVSYADRDPEFVDFAECMEKIPMEVANFLFKNQIGSRDPIPVELPERYGLGL